MPRNSRRHFVSFFACLLAFFSLMSIASAQAVNLNGKWDGYYVNHTKSPYVWQIVMASPTEFRAADLGGSGLRFRATLNGSTITGDNGSAGRLSPDHIRIQWADSTNWLLQPGTQTPAPSAAARPATPPPAPPPAAPAQAINLNGKWGGYYINNRKSPYTWQIVMAGPHEFRAEDLGGSGTKLKATISGTTVTADNGTLGQIAPDFQRIQWSDGSNWVLQPGTQTPATRLAATPTAAAATSTQSINLNGTWDTYRKNHTRDRYVWQITMLTPTSLAIRDIAGSGIFAVATINGNTVTQTLGSITNVATIAPDHIRLLWQGGTEWILQPGTQTATVPVAGETIRTAPPSLGPDRTVTVTNSAGYSASVVVTYYALDINGRDLPETVVSVDTLNLTDSTVLHIPRTKSKTPIQLLVKDPRGKLAPVTIASDFDGNFSYTLRGDVFNPTLSSGAEGVGTAIGPTRIIQFRDNAGYNAQMTVTYFLPGQVAPVNVETGYIGSGAFRKAYIPLVTAPGKPIYITMNGVGTVKSGIYQATLPADFAASPVPCFSAEGTLFTPSGGPCNGQASPATVRTITFKNLSGYVGFMQLTYFSQGIQMKTSSHLSLGGSESLQIPDITPATDIIVNIFGVATTKNPVFHTTVNSAFTGDKCFSVSGTIFNASGQTCR